MPMQVSKERIALVTGANKGLGFETCRQLGQRGYRVLLTSRDAERGQAAARSLRDEGLEVTFHVLDVTDRRNIEVLAYQLAEEGTRLDVLVNNAGAAFRGFDAEVARKTVDTNFYGALHVTDALLGRLRDGSNIVMVSSGMGELSCLPPKLQSRFSEPALTRELLGQLVEEFVHDVAQGRHKKVGWPSSAYSVSKVALNALARLYARELWPRHIRVNAVCPGWVQTDMGGPHADRSVERGASSILWAATLASGGPTGGFFRDGQAIPW